MVYDNIKRIAKEKDIPLYKIEDDCGYQRGAICKWKKCYPNSIRLKTIANYLDVSVDTLLEGCIEDS